MSHTRKYESLPPALRSAADELIEAKFPTPKRRSVVHRPRSQGKTLVTFGDSKPIEVEPGKFQYSYFTDEDLDTNTWKLLSGNDATFSTSYSFTQAITYVRNPYDEGTHI